MALQIRGPRPILGNKGGTPMRTIAVVAQKGGQWKTHELVNMAACLAGQGRRVLVIDSGHPGERDLVRPAPGRAAARPALAEVLTGDASADDASCRRRFRGRPDRRRARTGGRQRVARRRRSAASAGSGPRWPRWAEPMTSACRHGPDAIAAHDQRPELRGRGHRPDRPGGVRGPRPGQCPGRHGPRAEFLENKALAPGGRLPRDDGADDRLPGLRTRDPRPVRRRSVLETTIPGPSRSRKPTPASGRSSSTPPSRRGRPPTRP